ncbi:Male sterility protein [Nesidiocoris tenuis]|uniref:Fatty acyl-CoA reductase n=1 Tax=Nesidiocoris tenuis TaxID=355587 RepID=A0ABN7BCD3_9HEMI|nr:Male sterility protein [Nesidiocoris tenuis]
MNLAPSSGNKSKEVKMQPPSMAEWLSGKDILITGATGFMGTVLVEKLLRCFPNLNRLYLIVRNHKNLDPDDRIKKFMQNEAFGPLLAMHPDAVDKVTVIPGNISENGCGISKEHQQILKENVAIVFHVAASVRFDDSLTKAVKVNVKSTYELLEMAKNFEKLEVFEYVSTAYSNFNLQEEVGENVYPCHLEWMDLLGLVDKEEETLNALQGTHSNTYVLAKSLAEKVVANFSSEGIPAVIIRPSVVIPAIRHPLPGWTNNLNGPAGVLAGICKGFLRVFPCNPDVKLAVVPVDLAIDGFLVAAWSRRFLDDGNLQVFNQSYNDEIEISIGSMINEGTRKNEEDPFEISMWYPMYFLTKNFILFKIIFFFWQIIPALISDLLLQLSGKTSIVSKITKRLYRTCEVTYDFLSKENKFSNAKFRKIFEKLNSDDQEHFELAVRAVGFDFNHYSHCFVNGVRRYFFHEKDDNRDYRKTIYKRMFYIHTATKILLLSFASLLTFHCGQRHPQLSRTNIAQKIFAAEDPGAGDSYDELGASTLRPGEERRSVKPG